MNKIKLLTTAAIAAGALFSVKAPLAAQTIGFKVGPTFSKLDVSNQNDVYATLKSFGGGGFLRFGMMGVGLQAEALVVTKGAKSTVNNIEQTQKLNYLEIPVLARFGLGTGMISPYIMAGPSFGIELSCKFDTNVGGAAESSSDCEAGGESSQRSKLDIGVAGVAGLEFKAGPGNLFAEGRYTHGLTNLNKDKSPGNDQSMHNRSFAVMGGYSFTMR